MTESRRFRAAFAVLLFAVATTIPSVGQTFNTLATFDGSNGNYPVQALSQGPDGALYGVTYFGGSQNGGEIFKLTRQGKLTVVYDFCSESNCADGFSPDSPLLLADDGNFYGTTYFGGANSAGTIFRFSSAGKITTIYSFCSLSNCADGAYPNGALAQSPEGEIYGSTGGGGNPLCYEGGCGTVFSIALDGAFTTRYVFCSQTNCSDGAIPSGGVSLSSDGNFYGATTFGGLGACGIVYPGCGTVFNIDPAGVLTLIHRFCSQDKCPDGLEPDSGLVQASNGYLYGVTSTTIFKLNAAGTLTTLYTFCQQQSCPTGVAPFTLIEGTDRNLYGANEEGGQQNGGNVFNIRLDGSDFHVLYSFCSESGCDGGFQPMGGLVQATNGEFYGTTSDGGVGGSGIVYSLDGGLKPFVAFVRSYGKVGQKIGILGQGFTGTTSVSLNGTAASFRVVSDTFIEATVPVGATTGYVTVTTPGGTLTSNVPFRVLP